MTDKEWQQFECSGKIMDYLAYHDKQQADHQMDNAGWSVEHYGSDHRADRNDFVSSTYRGI